jgi:outer membrane receptor protein involved in Fe transport
MKLITLLTLSTLLLANEDILNLQDDLNIASEISTKTKLNINKTPAVVSVLHADELKKLGVTNVYEALETVPGIEVSMGIAGAKQINMRGNKSLVTDKLKFMVDGISINAELSGTNNFYLNMPIENIERIEVIRGPASALYGSFAHIGLINVITKASTHKKGVVFLRASSEGSQNVGFTQHINSEDIKIALNGSYELNENSKEYDNYSLLPSKGPFTSYEDFTSQALGINVELYKDISLVSKYIELDMQNHFGYGAWPIVQDPKNIVHTSWVNELKYGLKLTNELCLDLKLGYKEYSIIGQSRIVPYSEFSPFFDKIGDGNYKEESLYTDLSLNYSYAKHNILLGTYLSQTRADGTTYKENNISISEETTISFDGGGLQDKIKRTHYAFYLSDIISFSQKWIANIGLRYDNYSDVDSAFSPKLSLLYAYDERQSYKIMYQNSFRVPTFIETYGTERPFIADEKLNSETIDTLEFAYNYQNSFDNWVNINFFYSQMQNFIYRNSEFKLRNGLNSTSYGAELEFKTPIYDLFTLQANYSYIHSEDKNNVQTPLVANHLANAMLSYQINRDWHTGTKVRYVGERKREESDFRDPLKAYTSIDQTLTYTYRDFIVQASVKNIFNQDIIYSAPMGNGTTSGTYLNDLERNGRTFWLGAEWKFK